VPGAVKLLRQAILRHPVAAVLIVAILARVLVTIASSIVNDGVLIPDELQYIDLANTVSQGFSPEDWYPGYGQTLYDSTAAFTVPLVWLFHIFGPSRLAGQFFSAVIGAAVAGLTVAIALRFLRPAFAVIGGVVVALMPSQVLFSSVVLREAHIWFALALMALGAVILMGPHWRQIATGLALAAAGLLLLAFLREQTMLVAGWALFAVALFTRGARWLPRAAAVLVVIALVPWIGGFGAGGWRIPAKFAGQLPETREKLAVGANSAIVKVKPTTRPRGIHAPTTSADDDVTHNISRIPQGLLDVSVRPYPWETTSGIALLLARLENVLWYLLYALAVAGVIVSARRRPARIALQFPVLVTCLLFALAAVTQGNLGTAFRHRGQMLWALALCAAAGLQWLVTESRWAPRRDAGGDDSAWTTDDSLLPAEPARVA
jgi:hypothetical protein